MTAEQFVEAAKAGDIARVGCALAEDPGLASARLPSGETPVMAALYRGHHHVVEAILAAGATLDVFAAAALGRTRELGAALHDPQQVNAFAYDGWTPLHLAAFFGQRIAAEVLLDAGALVSAVSRNSMRNTPLHAAAAGRHAGIAVMLIRRGAATDVLDAGGYTPLRIAEENNLTDVVAAIRSGQGIKP